MLVTLDSFVLNCVIEFKIQIVVKEALKKFLIKICLFKKNAQIKRLPLPIIAKACI